MKYFENARTVTFEDLSKVVDSDGKRVYEDSILEQLSIGDYNCLNQLTQEMRENVGYMEPLLYAVKNERATYIVYKYYGEELQEDLGLLIEVVLEEPSIIEDTPISKNRDFMIDIVEIRPSVIMYVDESLKSDPEFIEELQELNDKGVDAALALEVNPELAHDAEFMKEAIKEDDKLLEFASPELKNDYEFMKDITRENYKTVEYVVQNRDDFGLEGIKGAKETTRELTVEDYMSIIDEMAESSDDIRYQKVRDKVQEKGIDDPKVIKWITAMVVQNRENVSVENFQKVFDNAILTMTKIKKDLTENGEINVSVENVHELITPQILNNLKEAAIIKGLEITPDQESLFEEYEEFYKEYREKLVQKKKQDRQNAEKENANSKENKKITLEQIEEKTADARISEINSETQGIREEYIETNAKEVEREDDESIGDETRA